MASSFAWPLVAHDGWNETLAHDGKPVSTQWTSTGNFDQLVTASEDDVRVTTGPNWQIRASGDPRALSQLRYLPKEDRLIVGRIDGRMQHHGKLRVEITAPALRSATLAGSGGLKIERLSGDRTSVTVAGSGDTRVENMDAGVASITIAGSGGLLLAGRSDQSRITIAGSGGMSGSSFRTRGADVTIAGSGIARFGATGPVRATLVGSGNVYVTGTVDCRPTQVGSGHLICIQ